MFSTSQGAIHSKSGGGGAFWLVLINNAPAAEWRGVAHSKPLAHVFLCPAVVTKISDLHSVTDV